MSYCVFMDVLGFHQIVKESFEAASPEPSFNRFYGVITEQVQDLRGRRGDDGQSPGWEMKVFTDNIVLGYPLHSPEGEREFAEIVAQVADYQLAMALEGFFVRGGLSYGRLFMDDYTVYGPAILDAHELESKKARDPRIVLSAKVHELVRSFSAYYETPQDSPYNKAVLIDPDGLAYINYLERLTSEGASGELVDWDGVRRHKENVEGALGKHYSDPSVWPKYYWLANYHDYFCGQYSHVVGYDEALLIDGELAKRLPSRLADATLPGRPATTGKGGVRVTARIRPTSE